jgi:hypothetical protein
MLRKKSESSEWLEFEIFQPFPELEHGVFLKGPVLDGFQGKQVHGEVIVRAPFVGDIECDGLMTDKNGVRLKIRHADCQAAILFDPVGQCFSVVHAGWRGNVLNIYERAIEAMRESFGSEPENVLVGISPSLGPCCAEFKNFEVELPSRFWRFQVKPTYFDLWEIGKTQLIEAGVQLDNIEVARICTCCNLEEFHSYRRDKTQERHVTTAMSLAH